MTKLKQLTRGDVALGLAAVSLFVAAGGPATAADLISGSQLKDKSVKGKKLAPRAVTNSRLAANAIGTGKVKDGTLTEADMVDTIFDKLQPLLTTNSVDSGLLGPDSVGSSELQAKSVGSTEIDDGAVGNRALGDGAVEASNLDNNAVTGAAADATGATTLNFASIADNDCASLTVPVTGADISNDVIIVTPGAGFTGSTATASVDTSGQFKVTVCNLSGSANDPDGASGVSYRWIAMNS